MVKKTFRKLGNLTFGGAALVKSTDVLAHARDPTALTGDISGLTGVGVASAFGKAALEMALTKPKFKKKKKRK